MKIIKKFDSKLFTLKGFFKEDKTLNSDDFILDFGYLNENVKLKQTYIYLGERDSFDFNKLNTIVEKIVLLNTRDYQIDPMTFTNNKVTLEEVVSLFVEKDEYFNSENLYCAKTTKQKQKANLSILVEKKDIEEAANKSFLISSCVTNARRLQATPPNICDSIWLANEIKKLFGKSKNSKLKISILDKKEIEKEKMNLLLSVNKGSAFEPRLVVIEYKGDPKSKENIAFLGKGITFDAGGYNLKSSQAIQGMKYDMSGAAICASALLGIVKLEPKVNVCAVLPLTDNKISSFAQTPDSIWTSMSGKTVEVNNTDAEGRLVLADAMTYAIKRLKATKLIDVATLTGAIIVSLGTTFTGTWASDEKMFEQIQNASKMQHELIWRMPFHDDFLKNIKKSNFADYKNTDLSGKGGSCSAAMFLKEFSDDLPYVHLDIAGTAGDGENPKGVMVKTLIQFALNEANKK